MGNATDIKHRPVRTIRLPVEQIARILDEMDGAAVDTPTARRDSRFKYRIKEIVILMQQPGFSAPMAFIAPTRNISARGLSFLHGGYVHPGTVCVVQLVTTRGGQQNVVATVRRCRYVQSNVHEVAVQFKHAVDPAVFCHDAVRLRVLLADDDAGLSRLAMLHLGRLNCDVKPASDGQAALNCAAESTFDLILLDMDLPVVDGYTVARELRGRGYTGMIVAGTGSDSAEDRKKAMEAGCDRHLIKPFDYEPLAELIASLQSEPLFSTFHDDVAMAELIADFVNGLVAKIRALEQGLAAKDPKALRTIVSDLKVESRGFGFEAITELASKVEASVVRNDPLEMTAPHIRALIRLCAQARSAPKSQAAGEAQSPVAATESAAPATEPSSEAAAPPPAEH